MIDTCTWTERERERGGGGGGVRGRGEGGREIEVEKTKKPKTSTFPINDCSLILTVAVGARAPWQSFHLLPAAQAHLLPPKGLLLVSTNVEPRSTAPPRAACKEKKKNNKKKKACPCRCKEMLSNNYCSPLMIALSHHCPWWAGQVKYIWDIRRYQVRRNLSFAFHLGESHNQISFSIFHFFPLFCLTFVIENPKILELSYAELRI